MIESTISGLIVESALRTPGAPAVIVDRGAVTYLELVSAARRVCSALRALGLPQDALVGVAAERNERYVAGVLGTMMAGCCFVPIDPNLPHDRVRRLLAQAGIAVVVAGRATAPQFQPLVSVVVLAELVEPSDPVRDPLSSARNW